MYPKDSKTILIKKNVKDTLKLPYNIKMAFCELHTLDSVLIKIMMRVKRVIKIILIITALKLDIDFTQSVIVFNQISDH